jgi:hypothetical protein
MLSGRLPFEGSSTDVLTAIVERPAPPLAAPTELAAIVARALARNPDERWPSANEMSAALTAYLAPSKSRAPLAVLVALACTVTTATIVFFALREPKHVASAQPTAVLALSSTPPLVIVESVPPSDVASVTDAPSSSAAPHVVATTVAHAPRARPNVTVAITNVRMPVNTHRTTQADLQALFDTHKQAFVDCYALLQIDPPLPGDLQVLVTVDNGRTGPHLRYSNYDRLPATWQGGSKKGPRVGQEYKPCIQDAIKTFDFKKVRNISATTELIDVTLSYSVVGQ